MKAFLDISFLIYLNTIADEHRKDIEELFRRLLEKSLSTDMLVVDETLYISGRRYGFPYRLTLDFLKQIVLPCVEIIAVEEGDLRLVEKYLLAYGLRPSDAIHLAVMEKANIGQIVTEDRDFDKVKKVKRIWLD